MIISCFKHSLWCSCSTAGLFSDVSNRITRDFNRFWTNSWTNKAFGKVCHSVFFTKSSLHEFQVCVYLIYFFIPHVFLTYQHNILGWYMHFSDLTLLFVLSKYLLAGWVLSFDKISNPFKLLVYAIFIIAGKCYMLYA